MAPTFSLRELYGGAITVQLPSNYVDVSDLRQVPDHQEVFLSSTTLTSIIFEINVYQSPSAVDLHSNISHNRQNNSQDADEAASTFHFVDPIPESDYVDPDSMRSPASRVSLSCSSISQYPAYTQAGKVLSPELDRTSGSVLPAEWHQDPPMKATETMVYQLLVRMKELGTDFCVRINVPLKELTAQDAREGEVTLMTNMLNKIVESLDVKDFGLFGEAD